MTKTTTTTMNEAHFEDLIEVVRSLDAEVDDLRESFIASGIGIDQQLAPHGYTLVHYAARASWGEEDERALRFLP